MLITLRPEAKAEVLSTRAWYDQQVPGLGRSFALAVDNAIAAISENPKAYRRVDGDCRRVLLRKFPYSVVYRVAPDGLLIVAVFHHSRDPGAWIGRLS